MTTTIDYGVLAAKAANNHSKFNSFAWYDRPSDSSDWCIVYTSNRDSRLLDRTNAAIVEKRMEPFCEADEPDAIAERHSHWAVGFVDGYAIRVYRNGEITEAFREWCDIQQQLDDYPVLDEEAYSQAEYEATIANIKEAGRRFVKGDAADGWEHLAFDWLNDNAQRAIENRDDEGGYPSDEEIKECLAALGLLNV